MFVALSQHWLTPCTCRYARIGCSCTSKNQKHFISLILISKQVLCLKQPLLAHALLSYWCRLIRKPAEKEGTAWRVFVKTGKRVISQPSVDVSTIWLLLQRNTT
jgi:hypothetical protein